MLKPQIESEITRALRTRDALRLSVFRMLSAAVHNREIEERTKRGTSELTEDNVVQVVRAELKKRREAEVAYAAGGRTEAAAQERAEAEIIAALLPPELTDDELEALVADGRAAVGAAGEKDFGKVMGWVMGRAGGRAGGDRVSATVKRQLAGS